MGWEVEYHTSAELGEDYNSATSLLTSGKFHIWCYPSSSIPHLTIYDGNMTLAKRCARISLFEPKYLYCNDCDIDDWIFSTSELADLYNTLSHSWDDILEEYIFQLSASWLSELKISITKSLPMPNYMKLK